MIEGLKFKGGEIGYRHFPKVACTSIKATLHNLDVGSDFDHKVEGQHIHAYYNKFLTDISNCKFRFVVVRDPILKFLSAYSNRVTHHYELSRKYIEGVKSIDIESIPVFNPSLAQFIESFDSYLAVPSIEWHVRPMSKFITDLPGFTNIYKLDELSFLQNDLSEIYGDKVLFGRDQTGGRKYVVKDLSSKDLEFLFEYYKDDYKMLSGVYGKDEIWKLWKSDW
jgi:hypothetical protein